jgi:class 3 adenylate cyclase
LQCPGCSVELPEGSNFCGKCGAALPRACPKCGSGVPPEDSFCSECGARVPARTIASSPPIVASASPGNETGSAAERRQLTIMFCDLVGSTALSIRLDPEDMRELVRAYQRCCADVITRAGGFLARFMGDGILAYFGYPQAHEHDAERAVRAGLSLLEAVPGVKTATGDPLQLRIGIATGLVVVGDLIGEGFAQERPAVGETPTLPPGCKRWPRRARW